MRSLLIMLVSALLGVGFALAGEAEQVAGQSAERAITVDSPNFQTGRGMESPATDDSRTGVDTEDAGPVTPQSAVPGSNGNVPGSSYYMGRGGRGHGYGRYRRGYGYGYPGYRGLGGGPYPHHRQYGNPPLYPAQPAANTTPADAE